MGGEICPKKEFTTLQSLPERKKVVLGNGRGEGGAEVYLYRYWENYARKYWDKLNEPSLDLLFSQQYLKFRCLHLIFLKGYLWDFS